MSKEFCTECGTEITGSTGYCPNCGAVTNKAVNQMAKDHQEREDKKNFERELKKAKLWYYKEGKNLNLAIYLNLLMPFLGIFYLKEEDKYYNYSIISIIVCVIMLLSLLLAFLSADGSMGFLIILSIAAYVIMWFVSTFEFILLYFNYNKNTESFEKYSDFLDVEYQHADFIEKPYFKFLPLLGILGFIAVVAIVLSIFGL